MAGGGGAAGAAAAAAGEALRALPGARVVLGTASAARRGVMDGVARELGVGYEVRKAGIDEKAIRRADPQELVLALADAKADAILAQEPGDLAGAAGVLITADQVVTQEAPGGPGAPKIILEKPESSEEFRAVARSYADSPPSTVSGLVVTNLRTGSRARGVDVVEIRFGSPLPDSTLETLEAEGDVFYCAGGVMVEHALVMPHIEAMGGTQDSVFGLPRALLLELLAEALGASG